MIFWRQILTALLTVSICLPSFGYAPLCSRAFLEEAPLFQVDLPRNILLPNALLKFDLDLYWLVRSSSNLKSLNLSKKELRRIEVKMAVLDNLTAKSSQTWLERVPDMGILRSREFKSLISKYSLEKLQDPYIRKIFLTQLSLLKENPWMGLIKSIELARKESIQDWADRNFEEQLINTNLQEVLKQFEFASPKKLGTARTYLKQLVASGWLKLPTRLPTLSKNLSEDALVSLLLEGPHTNNSEVQELMRQDHLKTSFNEFSRSYKYLTIVAFVIIMYSVWPTLSDELDKQIAEELENRQNTPEKIKIRDEKFKQLMSTLDQASKTIQEAAKQNADVTDEQQYQEYLTDFEKENHRPANEAEKQKLKNLLGV